MLRTILGHVLLEARKAGTLPPNIDTHYEIIFPEIGVADRQTLANATQMLVSALIAAKTQGWLSDETAMRLIFQFPGEEIDISEEQARIRKERPLPFSAASNKARRYNDYYPRPLPERATEHAVPATRSAESCRFPS